MRRLRKQQMYRGMISAKMITKEDIAVLERQFMDINRAKELNKVYTINRGHRFVEKLKMFGKWLYTHREEIFRILGVVVMLMDDGTPKLMTVEDAEKLEASRKPKPKRKPKKKKPTETPDGETVYDFMTPEVAEEVTELIEEGNLENKGEEDASGTLPKEVDCEEGDHEESSN